MDNLNDAFIVKQPPEEEFGLLSPGEGTAMVVGQSEKVTKNGPIAFVLEIDVLDGPNEGRKVFEYLNLNSPNQVAVKIAAETISRIAIAVGLPEGSQVKRDFSNIMNKRFNLVVSMAPKKKDGKIIEGEFENKKKFLPYTGGSKASTPVGATSTAASPAVPVGTEPKSSTPPWRQKKA